MPFSCHKVSVRIIRRRRQAFFSGAGHPVQLSLWFRIGDRQQSRQSLPDGRADLSADGWAGGRECRSRREQAASPRSGRLCIRMAVSIHAWSVSQLWLAACGLRLVGAATIYGRSVSDSPHCVCQSNWLHPRRPHVVAPRPANHHCDTLQACVKPPV